MVSPLVIGITGITTWGSVVGTLVVMEPITTSVLAALTMSGITADTLVAMEALTVVGTQVAIMEAIMEAMAVDTEGTIRWQMLEMTNIVSSVLC